jgi:glycosyltransferase involved in cell wall biosynthesis
MKFIYFTSERFPGTTADHQYKKNLAEAFSKELGSDFLFLARKSEKNALPHFPVECHSISSFLKRTIFYFFWVPFRFFGYTERTTFFTNDQNILSVLIFWKSLLRFPFSIVADWHMLSRTWRDSYIAKHADLSITTSHKLEKAVLALAPHARVKTIYGGVDLAPFETHDEKEALRTMLGLPLDKFLAGYVGLFLTMGMEKGIRTMIAALRKLPENCMMVFVGGKEKEIERYKKEAEEKGMEERCIFIPIQPFEKVVAYEKAMDVLAIPYPDKPHFRDFGFPMKVYEYMASGVPIVYTKLELLEEVISDCAYGVTPDSEEELARIISHIASHQDEAVEKAQKALAKAATYSWQMKAKNILQYLL